MSQGPQLINKEASVHNYGAMTSELCSFIPLRLPSDTFVGSTTVQVRVAGVVADPCPCWEG